MITKGRKQKFNKYERIIEAEIDLHGLTGDEAVRELKLFLSEAVEKKHKRVRVITGKGLHSVGGSGKIRHQTVDMLKHLGFNFRAGKPAEGGDGAIIIDF